MAFIDIDHGPSASQSATYEAVGNNLDFSPIITNIDVKTTPFLSGLTFDEPATEVKFHWPIEALEPPKENAHLEIEDYKFHKVGHMGVLSNNIQLFQSEGLVSDVQRETAKLYNQKDEFARQKELAFIHHARDLEYAIINNDKMVDGTADVPAKTGGFPFFLDSSALDATVDSATGLVTTTADHKLSTGMFVFFNADKMPAGVKASEPYFVHVETPTTFNFYTTLKGAVEQIEAQQVKPTDAGSNVKVERNNVIDLHGEREFTLDDIDEMMYKCTLRGGHPTQIWMSWANKKRFSKLLTAQTTTQRKNEKDFHFVADTYESDFGTVTAHPHMWYSDSRIDAIDPQYAQLKWFKKPHEVPNLPKKGNYSVFVIESSFGVKINTPLAHASTINCK